MAKLEFRENAPKSINTIDRVSFLTHPPKMRILNYLLGEYPYAQRVSDTYRALGMEQSICSLHLGELSKAGLVVNKREGQAIHYAPNYEQIEATMKEMSLIFKTEKSINKLNIQILEYENRHN
jgi:DNA-binding transcriptional ArsR family regulator